MRLFKWLVSIFYKDRMYYTTSEVSTITSTINRMFSGLAFFSMATIVNSEIYKLEYKIEFKNQKDIQFSIELINNPNDPIKLNFISTTITDYSQLHVVINDSYPIFKSFKKDLNITFTSIVR